MIQIFCKLRGKDEIINLEVGHLINEQAISEDDAFSIIKEAVSDNSQFIEITTRDRRYLINKSYIYSVIMNGDFDLDELSTTWFF